MTSGEQGPTDDVEGHAWRHGQDTEAVDDDRGHKVPDDAEGHGLRLPPEDETAGGGDDRGGRIPDDTGGHGWHHAQDPEATDEDQADDTEGHARR
jgi:hypothetical protein